MRLPSIKFKREDAWIGVYWESYRCVTSSRAYEVYKAWICVIPCIPIHIEWTRPRAFTNEELDRIRAGEASPRRD